MLMTDNNSQNWNFDEVSADDEGSDRLFIDIDSLWNMIEENPGSTENKPENLPVNIVPQGLSEIEGQSSYGAELPGSDTCSYSYNSEISDSRTRSSEGSFDSAAKSVTFDCVKQESSVQIDSPSLSGSLIDWTPKPLCYRQDIQFEIPNYPGISNFAAGATNHVSDIGGTLHPNNPKGLPHNWSMEESDISYGTYGDLSDNNSQTLGERHMEESSILNASLSSNSACHTQSSNCELPDIGSPDFLEFYNQYLHLQYSIGLESPLYISPSSNSACHTQSSNCELPDIDFPDIGSPHFLEFYNQYPHLQYSIGLESPLYISPSRQCFTENFGIQSVANNVERMANVKYQLERAGGAVTASSASSVMINSDVSGLNDNHKGADYILPSCGISTDNAEFGLTVGKASSTQILPLNLSNMPSKKQAVHMKDEKNNELCASQGIAYQSLTAIDGVAGRITSGVANGLSSKKQTFHVKDEKNYDLFAPQRTAYRSCIDVDVVRRRHSRVADGLSRKKHMFHVKDEKNEELFAAQGTAYRSCMDVDYESGRKSAGVTDGIFADKRTRQSLSSILTSISVESQAVENDERCDILIASNRTHHYFDEDETCRIISPVGNSHCQDVQASEQPCLQQSESVRRLLVSPLEDRDSNLTQSKSMGSQHSKLSCQAVQSNVLVQRSHVDDDSDVCILEDLSEPACRNQSPVNGKSHIASRSSSFIDSRSHFGGVRLKTNDERFIFRAALQDLSQPKSEATPPDGVLSVPLLRHQRIALSWMVQKETSSLYCSGGILADDQGLGKTISTIALILKERSPSSRLCTNNTKQMETLDLDADDGVTELNGTKQVAESCEVMADRSSTNCRNPSVQSKVRPAAGTLIVCPTSVLRQWSEELHNKVTREANLSVLTYHGGNRTKDPLELAKYDVILTTYAIVSMEVPKQPPVEEDDDETGRQSHIPPVGYPSTKKRKYPPSSDKRSSKSKKGDSELFESVAYPLAQVRWFRVVLDEAQSIKNHRTQVARACWGLRAKRRWCLSGTPIQNAIDDLYSYFRFLKYDPYAVFKSFCSTIKVPIQKNPAKGYRKLQAVLKTIMLRRTKGTILDGEPIINLPPKTIELKKVDFTMEERDFYCKLEADSRAQFAEYAAAGTVKQNYVNILLMLLRLRQACDHPLLVRGCGSNSMWTSSVEMVKKLPPEKQVSLLNCLEASLAICGICNDPPEDAVVASCGHVFCNQCICDHLTGDDNQCPTTNCKVRLSASLVFSRGTLRSSFPEAQESSADCSGSVLAETLEPCSSSGSFDSSKIRAALEVLQTLSRPRDLMPRTSSSITIDGGARCPENLSDPLSGALRSDSYNNQSLVLDSDTNSLVPVVGEKAIVFSQWTRMLDLLEAGLKDSSITYRRLDGTMSVVARDKAVKDFNTQPEVSVMIMSLKAASLGLNMVAACHVLLLDLWWNPTTEDQAIDRAHRIGQTRPVSVLRLTVKDTVEDRILALQQKKREMVASAFGEDETGSRQTSLTVEDLKYLFMYN